MNYQQRDTREGIPFPMTSPGTSTVGAGLRSQQIPHRAYPTGEPTPMDLDSEETGELDPCGIDASEEANSLPGIKHLFGIGRADALASVRRSPSAPEMPASGMATASPHASQHRPVTPSPLGDWPSATVPMSPPEQAAAFQGHFSGSSLGPMRHRHVLSFPTQMRGPATPPRTGHNLPGPSSESAYRPIIDENARWKPTQRTRSSQTVHGISLSPPTPLRSVDEPPHRGSQYPQRRRPSSSASSAPSRTANGGPGAHSYTLSDPSPRAPAMQHLATLGDPLWQHNVARQPMASAALVDTSTSATGKRPREARSGTPSARRHTVGSLDEPANLRRHNTTSGAVMGPPIAHVAHASTPDDRATPRAADRARVYAPESPTTPTFANARRQMSDLSRVQQIYLQQNEHFTASLPSLSSSVSSSSLGSDRPRLLSFDESYQEQGIASSGHSDVTSPRSSWHSRSSANDASDTAKPMPPPRSSSLGQEESPASSHHGSVGQMPDTWSSGAGPTFGMVNDAYQGFDQHGRLRHGSLREVRTPHDAALPSSESRPRARTMAFASRQIARLPAGDERARRAQAHSQDEVLASSMAVQLTAAHLRGPEHGYTHAQGARPEGSFEPAKRPKSHSVSSHDSAGPAGTHGSQRWQPSAQDQSWHMRSATTPSGFPLEAHDTPQHPQAMYRSDSRPPASSVVPTGFESFHPRTGRGGRDGPHSVQNVVTVPQRSSSMDVDEYGSPNSGTLTNAGSALPDSSGVVGPRGSGIPAQHAAGPSAGATIASGQAKYECAWCGKRFSRPSSLKIHHHSHTGEKPFVCNEPGCGRSFSVQSNLRRHQKCHLPGADPDESARSSAGRSSHLTGEQWRHGDGSGGGMAGPSAPRPFAVAGSAYPHQYKSFLSQGHPPLSRSAYEPGSRSQGLWSDVNRGEFHPIPPAQHDASRTQPDVFGGMQVSMQAHHRRQSASSMDDDVEDDSQSAGRNDDRRSAWSSEDEENVATRMRRDTTGSTTSMRVGFASLLNPVAASVDGQDP